MSNKILCLLVVVLFQLIQFSSLYGAGNTITLENSTTSNPVGTYTTNPQLLDGFTQMMGIVVINSQNAPTAYINQAVDASSAITNSWHGTNTITFSQSGGLWIGTINVDIQGKYGRMTVGGFGTATFNKINWFASFQTTVSTTINLTSTAVGSGTVKTIGTSSTTLMDANSSRRYMLITNTGGQDLYVDSSSPVATGTARIWIASNGGSWEKESISAIYTGAIYCCVATGTTEIRVFEHN